MDQYQLLDEILQAVDTFKMQLDWYQKPVFLVGQKKVAKNCTDKIISLVKQHQNYQDKMPKSVPCTNRKVTKIGIAVGDAYDGIG